jgi:hypothetical protein
MDVENENIVICVAIPRPKGIVAGTASVQDYYFEGEIKSPISPSQFVTSVFQLRIGDIIVIEGGEILFIRDSVVKATERSLSFLATQHRITSVDNAPMDNART